MGASASQLSLKNGISKLSTQRRIPPYDEFWEEFWKCPESIDDICLFFSSSTIRHVRDVAPENLKTLIQTVFTRLADLRDDRQFPSQTAPATEALNCIRILGRILPYVYEHTDFASWEDSVFWTSPWNRPITTHSQPILSSGKPIGQELQSAKGKGQPLGERLIDLLIDLLFCRNFTISDHSSYHDRTNLEYSIWQIGVGCSAAKDVTPDMENNRIEILRLLLVLLGKALYLPQNVLPTTGIKAATYLTARVQKYVVTSLLCSLLNTALQFSPELWRTTYEIIKKNNTQSLATYSLEVLNILTVYAVPPDSDEQPPRNLFRHLLGRIHKPADLEFIFEGLSKNINQPLHSLISYLPGGAQRFTWAPNMVTLFWESMQCNKKFRIFVHESGRCIEFTTSLLFYLVESRGNPTSQGFLRLCAYVLQTMSTEPGFGKSLNAVVESQESIPSALRIHGFQGTYADFLIMILYPFLSSKKEALAVIRMPLLTIIRNISPYITGIGKVPSARLLALLSPMSSSQFLLANDSNRLLLHRLLESFSFVLENHYKANPELVLAILEKKPVFLRLRSVSLNGGLDHMLEDQDLVASSVTSEPQYEPTGKPSREVATPQSTAVNESSPFEIGDEDDDDEDNDVELERTHPGSQQTLGTDVLTPQPPIALSVSTGFQSLSEKAKGKLPMDYKESETPLSQQASRPTLQLFTSTGFVPTEDWLESWLPHLPLHVVLMIIGEVDAKIPNKPSRTVEDLSRLNIHGFVPSIPKPISFEWMSLTFGWYQSLLWGYVFSFELAVSKGTSGVWAGTAIRLFKVQEAAAEAPSLLAPRGAVDAVGSNLVSMLNSVNLRSNTNSGSEQNQQGRGGRRSGGQRDPVVIREL